jgi:hypothetical protein
MSKVMLALGSFIVGACCAFAISAGIQTSTWAQPSGPVSVFGGRGVTALSATGTIPKVPGLIGVKMSNMDFPPAQFQQLDGLDCERCTFHAPLLAYGGGAFKLVDTTFDGVVEVRLMGAALNTFQLLKMFGAFKQSKPSGPPPLFTPPTTRETSATVKAQAKTPTAVTLISAVQ